MRTNIAPQPGVQKAFRMHRSMTLNYSDLERYHGVQTLLPIDSPKRTEITVYKARRDGFGRELTMKEFGVLRILITTEAAGMVCVTRLQGSIQ